MSITAIELSVCDELGVDHDDFGNLEMLAMAMFIQTVGAMPLVSAWKLARDVALELDALGHAEYGNPFAEVEYHQPTDPLLAAEISLSLFELVASHYPDIRGGALTIASLLAWRITTRVGKLATR